MRHRLLLIGLLSAFLGGCGDDTSQADGSTDSGIATDLAGVGNHDLLANGDMSDCPAMKPTPFTPCTNTPGTVTGPTCAYPSGTCTCADASWTC